VYRASMLDPLPKRFPHSTDHLNFVVLLAFLVPVPLTVQLVFLIIPLRPGTTPRGLYW
jgi:hypothetical protein